MKYATRPWQRHWAEIDPYPVGWVVAVHRTDELPPGSTDTETQIGLAGFT